MPKRHERLAAAKGPKDPLWLWFVKSPIWVMRFFGVMLGFTACVVLFQSLAAFASLASFFMLGNLSVVLALLVPVCLFLCAYVLILERRVALFVLIALVLIFLGQMAYLVNELNKPVEGHDFWPKKPWYDMRDQLLVVFGCFAVAIYSLIRMILKWRFLTWI